MSSEEHFGPCPYWHFLGSTFTHSGRAVIALRVNGRRRVFFYRRGGLGLGLRFLRRPPTKFRTCTGARGRGGRGKASIWNYKSLLAVHTCVSGVTILWEIGHINVAAALDCFQFRLASVGFSKSGIKLDQFYILGMVFTNTVFHDFLFPRSRSLFIWIFSSSSVCVWVCDCSVCCIHDVTTSYNSWCECWRTWGNFNLDRQFYFALFNPGHLNYLHAPKWHVHPGHSIPHKHDFKRLGRPLPCDPLHDAIFNFVFLRKFATPCDPLWNRHIKFNGNNLFFGRGVGGIVCGYIVGRTNASCNLVTVKEGGNCLSLAWIPG